MFSQTYPRQFALPQRHSMEPARDLRETAFLSRRYPSSSPGLMSRAAKKATRRSRLSPLGPAIGRTSRLGSHEKLMKAARLRTEYASCLEVGPLGV